MNSLIRLLAVLSLGLMGLAANAVAQDAKVLRIVGNAANATITKPGQAPVPLTQGMAIAQNDTITTGFGVEVYVQPYPGAVATIKADSTVQIERLGANQATLDLRHGDIVSQIDPARQSDYQVRTPRGVAAARGTAFTVTIRGETYSVATFGGGVTVTPVGGGTPILVGTGTATVNGQAAVPLSEATGINVGDIAAAALAAVAVVKETNALGDAASQALLDQAAAAVVATGDTAVITQATAAAAAAAPSQAAAVVTSAIQSAVATGNQAQVAAAVTQAAAQGVGQAAAQAAAQGTDAAAATNAAAQQASQIAQAAVTALGGSVTQQDRQTIANAATAGAVAGLTTNAVANNPLAGGPPPGVGNITTAIANQAVAGANTGAAPGQGANPGQVIAGVGAPPTGVGQTPVQTTPITPIDPTINVSPSGAQ